MSTMVGVNYKSQLREELLANTGSLDILEVTTEKLFIQNDDPVLEILMSRLPVSLHGLDLSLGSSNEMPETYCANLSHTLSATPHEWFSDHLSLTAEDGVEVGHLMPMQLSNEDLERTVAKILAVQAFSDRPFLVENITSYYPIPGSSIPEADFLRMLCEATGCGLLLDVNNLYINASNHHFDPMTYLEQLPLDRIIEVHLAGGSRKFGMMVDTHTTDVWREVWELFDQVCRRIRPQAVIIERDSNFGLFSDTLAELDIARGILARRGLRKPLALTVAAA
ncbi:hypothetical protein ADT25_13725 [Xanthomonas oryzae]|uniref:DUF692 domain-containing protein n=1 Tax=Xanthomonas oryzae TaxID=347 RepID=A0AAP0ZKF8_9XANT|nr:DUF692 domain-containing protein [Xanthomonas oryzae]KOR42796.1 hypothetical protein ADT25_13725 [Xanthomonas oryzae]QBG82966.1 DUF692 domain-containing protein [Xanthomonas oryzae]